jgi:hypothetical protein
LFFHKNKITFYPVIKGLEVIEPIVEARESTPEWFKTLKIPGGHTTIQQCPGIQDYVSKGYVVRLWQDLEFIYDPTRGFGISPANNLATFDNRLGMEIQTHPEEQYQGLTFFKKQLPLSVKLRCPWYVETPPGVDMLMLPLTFENQLFKCVPGILKTSMYHVLLAQMIFDYVEGPIILKKGTPLFQLIPLTDKKLKLTFEEPSVKICNKIDKTANWLYSKKHPAAQYNKLTDEKFKDEQ